MQKIVLVCLALAAVVLALPLQDSASTRSMVRVFVSSASISSALDGSQIWSENGVEFGKDIDAVVDASVLSSLHSLGANFTVMIPDVDGLIAQQAAEFANRANEEDYNKNYHTLEEVTERLKFFANNFPNVDFIETIGDSTEGRHVPAIRFGRRATSKNDAVPTVWYEANIHAREWITGATTMYIIQKMLEGAETEYKDLFEGLQFYVAPIVNPDGFAYTHSNNRLWRLNRRRNADGSYGVDLNRNWDDHWGGGGASSRPGDETYRGTGPFSEIETKNIANFLDKLESEGAVIESAWDLHSYSQLILRPFGWTYAFEKAPSNDAAMTQLGEEMKAIVKGVHGLNFVNEHSSDLYICSGIACDWLAARTKQQKAYTFELRDTGRYGFLLPKEQIIPSGEEILPSFVHFARDTLRTVRERKN